jgi:alpha-glucosidase
MLLLTLRGTPTLYYGDELGLENMAIPPDRVQDPWEKNEPGLGLGRDPARTPMPWDESADAGFTAGEPWLPMNTDCKNRNVSILSDDPRSILTLYRRLIALRRERAALHAGDFRLIGSDDDVLAFERQHGGEPRLLVALNFSSEERHLALPGNVAGAHLLLSTALDRDGATVGAELRLRPAEGVIVEVA